MKEQRLWLVLLGLLLAGRLVAAPVSLDARLTDFDYPFPVQMLSLEDQQQDLEMAYMDVAPKQGNGKTVLLLHGKNFSGAYWQDTMSALLAEGYRVVAPDQIGFGKSSKPAHFQYSFQTLADQTRRLLDTLKVDRVTVVGHSMGGMLATRFALMFPDRSDALVLVNPIGLEDWQRKQVPWQSVDAWYQGEMNKNPEKVKAYMTRSYFDGQWKKTYDPLLTLQQGWMRGPDYRRIAWSSALHYDMIYSQPVVHDFDRLTLPTLLIIGTRDRTALGRNRAPEAQRDQLGRYDRLGKEAASRIPHAALVEMDGIGHVPQYEAFDDYIAALKAFLNRH
ncbi:MAG: alpha/beta hydrolase [Pseudomonadota bacterium]|uniref:alpha/beta fold hydrolase n=1 Tax=Alcanivorax sp. NBRC 102024 TaxID=1113895 RepID=UPI000789E035|nr:alpha/beta hydrolase [Alcanivorax sp. NBRC 102024]MEE2604170.1 alpha/beta hydrolase [Pseudomonadota bacterium]